MNHKHNLHQLIEWENGYVGFCSACRTYNVAYKNSLFVLAFDDFDWFREMLTDKIGMNVLHTSHGKEIMLHTPMKNYFMLFTHDEVDELLTKINEVSPLIEARGILSNLN